VFECWERHDLLEQPGSIFLTLVSQNVTVVQKVSLVATRYVNLNITCRNYLYIGYQVYIYYGRTTLLGEGVINSFKLHKPHFLVYVAPV